EPARLLQVERDAPFSSRVVLVENAAAVEAALARRGSGEPGLLRALLAGARHERRHQTDRIRARSRLDPDHLGAEGAAERGRLGAVAEAGQIDDADAGERGVAHGRD